jgi:hypothetical protein
MTQAVLRIAALPAGALDAAAAFHGEWTTQARTMIESGHRSMVVILPPAPYDHSDWRRAAARDLARAAAPARVNIVAGDDESAIAATLAFLQDAAGVTGQYLPLDGQGAANAAD